MAIVVPYRDRLKHLKLFVPFMHKFLTGMKHDIFIVHQIDNRPFNRAKLLNVGFQVAGKNYDYMATHDIDMLPITADYSFPTRPCHVATAVEQFGYKLPFKTYFGGVVLFNANDFVSLNGYSNNFWGWGGEDDEMFRHIVNAGITIERRVGRFKSLPHDRNVLKSHHQRNVELLNNGRLKDDGLDHCAFKVYDIQKNKEYTTIKVFL